MLSSPKSSTRTRAAPIRALAGPALLTALLLLQGSPALGQAAAPVDRRAGPEIMEIMTEVEVGPSLSDLERISEGLKSAEADVREATIARLSSLPQRALPAIRERLEQLRSFQLDRPTAIPILERLIALSDKRSPEASDLEPMPVLATGAAQLLAETRDARTRMLVETALLLASLEALRTTKAGLTMAAVMPIAGGAFRAELRRVRIRAGEWLLPALVSLRSHDNGHVKRWAQAGVRGLGYEDPLLIVNLEDPKRLAEVITAYSEPLDFDAMPTLVRLSRSDRLQVREAARAAVARFGKNAIWQLRELYEELTSERAPHRWGSKRTARELYAVIDRPRTRAADQALARGLEAFEAGDFVNMERAFAIALTKRPDHPSRAKMTKGYAAAGMEAMRSGDLERAEAMLRAAVHLGDDRVDKAQLTYVRARQSLARGVVDQAAFENVLALDPAHAGALAALDRISGRHAELRRRKKQRALYGGAALLLVAAGLALRHGLRRAPDDGPTEPDQVQAST